MKTLAGRIRKLTADYDGTGYPIDIGADPGTEYHRVAAEVTKQFKLAKPIPAMCTLVTASPFDVAIHDASDKVHGLNCYQSVWSEVHVARLSRYPGPEYQGEYINRYVSAEPRSGMPMCHPGGAVDPIKASDIKRRIDDGLSGILPEGINHNGLAYLKIKLNGKHLDWDVDRAMRADRVAAEKKKREVDTRVYSLDFDRKAPDVQYLLDFMRQVKERTPRGYDRIQYVEQSTARDLRSAEIHDVPLCSRFDLLRGALDSIDQPLGARPDRSAIEANAKAVCIGGRSGMGNEIPTAVHRQGRHEEDGRPGRGLNSARRF